ncbi:MAG: hypothetical protein EXS60_01695 [Candidatus Pacebacteria bacterium]|nr:hypothetical protein [Candidatus Paceibacterota bacterium]
MTIVHSVKDRAIELRRKGFSYSEILEKIPVAKSTLSLWLHSVGLSKKQKQRLSEKKRAAMLRGALKMHDNKVEKITGIKNAARKEISAYISNPLWLTGLILYWSEGSKEKIWGAGTSLKFSNMDVAAHRIFIKWTREFGKYSAEDFKYEIYIHETADIEKAKRFWAGQLGVPINAFRIYIKSAKIKTIRKNRSEGYYGVLRTCVLKSIDFNRRIAGWTEGVIEYLR